MLILCLVALAVFPSSENDAGPAVEEVSIPTVSPPADTELPTLDNPVIYLRGFYKAVRAGNYFEAAALLVIAFVAGLRFGGKRLHEWLRDDHPLDRILWFLFDTKPGRILNLCLTTAGAGIGGAWVLGEPITPELVKPIVLTTFTASTLFGWAKDFMEWRDLRKAARGGAP